MSRFEAISVDILGDDRDFCQVQLNRLDPSATRRAFKRARLGVCDKVPYAKEGADCSDANIAQCPPDLACVGGGQIERTADGGVEVTAPTCQHTVPLGTTCEAGECSSGYCDMTTKTCAELPVEGSTYCVMR